MNPWLQSWIGWWLQNYGASKDRRKIMRKALAEREDEHTALLCPDERVQ